MPAVEVLERRTMFSGTWTALTHLAPGGVRCMLLLADGSVMAEAGLGPSWYRLTPDANGSYLNGTWSQTAPMGDTRLYFSSDVLQDGRVFVAGGEYGSGRSTAEVYNPLTNAWQKAPASGQGFVDSVSETLPNGNVLVAPVSPSPSGSTIIFNPSTNTWTPGPSLVRGGDADEQSWVKLQDGSILTIDSPTTSERYIPSLNQWVNDGSVPVNLWDGHTEIGPGFLLPDGRAYFLGATGHTALYTPSGSSSPGTWAAGPDIPSGQGMPDAPGAMMVDGNILFAVGPAGTLNGPTVFDQYNFATNSITTASSPTTLYGAPYGDVMLDLPDGTVLFNDGGLQLWDYNPNDTPLAAGQPTISNLAQNADGSFVLTGTLFNGISEGAAFGDDAQMASNYPVVRLTNPSGNVYYARTYNWSSTGVATGSAAESTDFVLPLGIPAGTYSVYVVANGIASSPVPVTISTTSNNSAPTIATPAAATPAPVTGASTNLSVLGVDDGGEPNLVYTWTIAAVPSGAPTPSLSVNGSNSAKNTTATFYQAGTYGFNVTITDVGGLSTSGSVNVTVDQTMSRATMTPAKASLSANGTWQFEAQAFDQFGFTMAPPSPFTWAVSSGGGSINSSGLYTAPGSGTLATVTATSGAFQVSATVGVVSPPWTSLDIGSSVTGFAYDTGGTFSVSGEGADVGGTADQFRFVYTTLGGDGTITARVATEQNTNASAKCGVMVRNSLASNDQYAFMAVTPGTGTSFEYRTTSGSSAVVGGGTPGLAAPYWVRLVRSGNSFTSFSSVDGSSWTQEGSTTIAMGEIVYIGMAVCSHSAGQLNTATFDNVSVPIPLPAVTGLSFIAETPSQLAIQWNPVAGATGYRIERSGDGSTFSLAATVAADTTSYADNTVTPLQPNYYRVFALSGATFGLSGTVIFAATPAATPLPAPWQSQDIGPVGGTGAAGFGNGTFTAIGSGADIGNTADAFRFTYESLTGDGEIIARVVTQQGTTGGSVGQPNGSGRTQSGVMIRQSLGADSSEAFMLIAPYLSAFQYRSTTGGPTSNAGISQGFNAPYWVKLVRIGDTFTGYQSADGITWTQQGSATITMTGTVYVGLAVCAVNNSALSTSTFDNVAVNQASSDVIFGTTVGDAVTLTQDKDGQHVDWSIGGFNGEMLIADANGLTINGLGGNDSITLDNTRGNPLPNTLHLNGTFTINGLSSTNPLSGTTMEMGKSTVFINYAGGTDPLASIKAYLQAGYNNGAWNSTSANGVITSAAAASNASQTTAIGYADSADGLIAGQPVNTIELKYTLYGDTTLTGTVGHSDFTRPQQHYNQTTGGTWDTGDFNYDGSVNFNDFTLLTRTYNTSLGAQALPAATLAAGGPSTGSRANNPAASSAALMPAVNAKPADAPSHPSRGHSSKRKRHA